MTEKLKGLLSTVERYGFVALPPIIPSQFDTALLANALGVAPSQSLMHYLPLHRFETLLANNAIYMSRLDSFQSGPHEDQHEGRFPATDVGKESSLTQGFVEKLGLPAEVLRGRRDFIEGPMRQLIETSEKAAWRGWL